MPPAADLHDRLRAYLLGEPAALVDPYPLFRELREAGAVHDLGSTAVVARYEDVRAVLLDAARLSSRTFVGERVEEMRASMTGGEREAFERFAAFDDNMMQHNDGERHARLRRIAARAFTPRRIAALRERIQEITDELLADVEPGVVTDIRLFAYRLPLLVVMDLLDAPRSMMGPIREWSGAIGASRGITTGPRVLAAVEALERFEEFVTSLAEELRARPRSESLVGALIDAEQGEQLTTEELTCMFIVILFAGHETTTNLLSIGLLDLLRHRDQWQRLCDDPEGVAPAAVEELMRYSNPVQTINRVALTDLELAGHTIREGQAVVGLLGAANRDPAAHDDPDRLDVGRGGTHLGFGHGPHFCIGSALARLEAEVALITLASRYPRMQLAADPDSLAWSGNAMLRFMEALPVTLEP